MHCLLKAFYNKCMIQNTSEWVFLKWAQQMGCTNKNHDIIFYYTCEKSISKISIMHDTYTITSTNISSSEFAASDILFKIGSFPGEVNLSLDQLCHCWDHVDLITSWVKSSSSSSRWKKDCFFWGVKSRHFYLGNILEYFKKKNDFPNVQPVWNNIFWSPLLGGRWVCQWRFRGSIADSSAYPHGFPDWTEIIMKGHT